MQKGAELRSKRKSRKERAVRLNLIDLVLSAFAERKQSAYSSSFFLSPSLALALCRPLRLSPSNLTYVGEFEDTPRARARESGERCTISLSLK